MRKKIYRKIAEGVLLFLALAAALWLFIGTPESTYSYYRQEALKTLSPGYVPPKKAQPVAVPEPKATQAVLPRVAAGSRAEEIINRVRTEKYMSNKDITAYNTMPDYIKNMTYSEAKERNAEILRQYTWMKDFLSGKEDYFPTEAEHAVIQEYMFCTEYLKIIATKYDLLDVLLKERETSIANLEESNAIWQRRYKKQNKPIPDNILEEAENVARYAVFMREILADIRTAVEQEGCDYLYYQRQIEVLGFYAARAEQGGCQSITQEQLDGYRQRIAAGVRLEIIFEECVPRNWQGYN